MFCHKLALEKVKKNGMSAPWPKLNIQNLCLELSRKKGFLAEVSCLQPMAQHASLGDVQAAFELMIPSPP